MSTGIYSYDINTTHHYETTEVLYSSCISVENRKKYLSTSPEQGREPGTNDYGWNVLKVTLPSN